MLASRIFDLRRVGLGRALGLATRALAPLVVLTLCAAPLRSQTIDDGIMMPRNVFCTGVVYGHDSWDQYWEGTLKRGNGNIGTVTTESLTWSGNYGITSRLNVIAMVPYIWTSASQGTLHGQKGLQDLTVALKYNLLDTPFTKAGNLRAIVVASGSTPLSDYVPDLLPLTIGSASSHLSGRVTLNFQAKQGWFINTSGSYTWRDKVTLDRPAYYTDGQLTLSDQVLMPDVFDYELSAGYNRHGFFVPVSFTQRITLGGGDIRRQDMPFISNKMNVSKVDGVVMYYLPKPKHLAVRLEANYAFSGRNVGQATAVTAGLMYFFHF
jgi:hypothetical protein